MVSTTVNLNTMLTLQNQINKALQQMDNRVQKVNVSLKRMSRTVINPTVTLRNRTGNVFRSIEDRCQSIAKNIGQASPDTDSLKEYGRTLATVLDGVAKFLDGFENITEAIEEGELLKLGKNATGKTTNRGKEAKPKKNKTGKSALSKKAEKSDMDKLIERYNLNNEEDEVKKKKRSKSKKNKNSASSTKTRKSQADKLLERYKNLTNVEDEVTGPTKPVQKPSLISRAKSRVQNLETKSYLGRYEKVAGKGSKTIAKLGKAGKIAGRFAKPADLLAKGIEFAMADDKVKVGSQLAGDVAGSAAGATVGAALGTLILPGVGTVIGGYLGSLAGGELGSRAGGGLVDLARKYNVIEKVKGAGQTLVDFAGDALGSRTDGLSGKYLSNPPLYQPLYQQQPLLPPIKGGSNILPFGPLPTGTGTNRIPATVNQQLYFNMTINSQADANQVADLAAQKIAWEVGKTVQNRAS